MRRTWGSRGSNVDDGGQKVRRHMVERFSADCADLCAVRGVDWPVPYFRLDAGTPEQDVNLG